MRRREFIATLSGFGIKWAADLVGAHAEQRKSRVGALMVIAESDPDAQRFVKAIETQLDAAGWHNGRNLEITYRWGASDPQLLADYAQELVVSAPDVLLALGTPALVPLRKATTTIPIVFTSVSDPVAQGFVASLARPGGNITGFANFEPNIGAKWLQLLKEVAPSVTQTNVMFNPNTSPYNSLWMHSIEIASPSFGVSTSEMVVQSKNDIKSGIELLATKTGSSLVVPSDSFTFRHSAFIVGTCRHPPDSGCVCVFQVRLRRWTDCLRHRPRRAIWRSCSLHRPCTQGYKAR